MVHYGGYDCISGESYGVFNWPIFASEKERFLLTLIVNSAIISNGLICDCM